MENDRVGLARTDGSHEHKASNYKDGKVKFGVSVYYYTPPDLKVCG